MSEKELIRKALMGNKQAQEKCTVKGIALPCPLCGSKASIQKDITGKKYYHVVCNNVKDRCNLIAGLPMWSESEEEAIEAWNTRPATPIGRCGECAAYTDSKCSNTGYYKTEQGFCNDFEPKEEWQNERHNQ